MCGRVHTLMIAVLAAGWACVAFAGEDGFSVNARIYRIENTPVYVYGEDAAGRGGSAHLEARLDSPITFSFEKVHVQEILEFMRKIYEVEFRVDENLIAPAGQDAAGYVTDGMVAYVNLKEVALRQGLTALLHPMGLAFVAEGDHIRVRRATEVSHAEAARQTPPLPFAPGDQWNVLTKGEIRVGHSIVSLSADSAPRLIGVEGVEFLGNPVMTIADGQEAKIDISGSVEYLAEVPGADGTYKRHHTPEQVGLSLGLACDPLVAGTAECDLDLSYSYVKERRLLPGTSLPAGEPLIANTATQQKTAVVLGKPIAMLARLGERNDDLLLAVVQVTRMSASAMPARPQQPRQYTLETTFLQVRGEPNWEWWMRPYDRAYRIYEGAGRVIGPVSVPDFNFEKGKKIDWPKLGMRQVKQERVLSSPRATGIVDHKRLIQEGVLDARGEPVAATQPAGNGGSSGSIEERSFGHIDELYEGMTGIPRGFTREDLEGKLLIADISQMYRQENGQIKPITQGVAVFGEAVPTTGADVISVEQLLLAHDLRLGVQKKENQPDSDFFRIEMRHTTDMSDGATNAFLLPIAEDEFLVVLSKFQQVEE